MCSFKLIVVLSFWLTGGWVIPCEASDANPLSPEILWSLKRVGPPALSADGLRAVIPVTSYDITANLGDTELFVLRTAGPGAPIHIQLTNDAINASDPTFSPDGKWVAFAAKRKGDTQSQIYIVSADGGEPRRILDVATGATAPKWFNDSRRIAFVSRVWPGISVRDTALKMKSRENPKMTAQVWEHAPFSQADHLLDDREAHVFITDINGSEPFSPTLACGRSLPGFESGSSSYGISPEGTQVAFTSDVDKSHVQPNLDIFLVDTGGDGATDLTATNLADDREPVFSPDGRWIAFVQHAIPGFRSDLRRLVLYDRKTKLTREVTPGFDRSVDDHVWSADAAHLYVSAEDAGKRRIFAFSLQNSTLQPLTSENDFGSLAVAGERPVVLALLQSFSEPPTLVRVDAASGASTKLSSFNDQILAAVSFGSVESVTYTGSQGAPIQMWLVKPPHFNASKSYPSFVMLHGGPHAAMNDTWSWRWNAQIFAGLGYIAAWPNYHGSTGFGLAFTDSISGNWADLPYQDIISASTWLSHQPFVDRQKMVAGGGSFGGYLAEILMGREHPFKALIAHAGLFDWHAMYASDGGANKRRFGEYWENTQAFDSQSPNSYAAKFKTPTLIVHNQLDYRVPVDNGFELFQILQNKGIPSKLIYFPDEGHQVSKPQNSIFWYHSVADWLKLYAPP